MRSKTGCSVSELLGNAELEDASERKALSVGRAVARLTGIEEQRGLLVKGVLDVERERQILAHAFASEVILEVQVDHVERRNPALTGRIRAALV